MASGPPILPPQFASPMHLDLTRLSRTMRLQKLGRKALPPIRTLLDTVPDEVMEHILSFCAQREVLAISLTCWRLAAVANGTLYRYIRPLNLTKSACFFRTIYLHEHLGTFVRKYRNPLLEIENELIKRYRKLKPKALGLLHDIGYTDSLALVTTALRKMPNLSHLELLFPETEIQTDYVARLLEGCPFQLLHFHTNLRFDLAMAKFLHSQDDLQDLRLHSSTPFSSLDMTTLNGDMLPKLSTLGWSSRVPIELVRHLVKGRPIHTIDVQLPSGIYDISDFLGIGVEASPLVRVANITFRDPRHPLYSQLEVLNIQFPNLTGLGIAVFALTQEITNDLYKIVKSFKQLERLFIYDQFHDLALTRGVILQYARSFWNRCATLRKIGFYVCDPFLMVEKTTVTTGKVKTVLWVVRS
ncbi:hypothetical protein HYPSUDRAFT_57762 [Hypholoma sublateritium FD-334 SS-4]|uniref:F-box domain-containing protein n=1 Tax=Hypholoma sublateritium (strain FD-334 SS-4) TaxID=945553 RepID=A0A0D2NL45_HYPSF|nr:hypothetical protein HYPSUDRAFT_57762 [Hypholoma sublateritium FD-334 SS-4]